MVRPGYKTAAFLTRFRLIADNCSFIALYSVFFFFALALFLIIMCVMRVVSSVFYYVVTTRR